MADKLNLPELVLKTKVYTIGYGQQLLSQQREVVVLSSEKVKTGPRSTENCLMLDDGQRIIITNKSRLALLDGIDGILRVLDNGALVWIVENPRKLIPVSQIKQTP